VTGSTGLLVCLLVILVTQSFITTEQFKEWGWRVPFLLSFVLLVVSTYIRSKLHESPVFTRMKAEKKLSENPIRDAFTKLPNLKLMLLALVGITAGMGANYFTGQFYVMIFLQQAVLIDQATVYKLVMGSFIVAAPAYVFFGWLSDRWGAKWIMMAGLFLAAICYRPMFAELTSAGNPALAEAIQSHPVLIHASENADECHAGFAAAVLGSHPDNSKACVQAKKFLVSKGISFHYGAPVANAEVAMSVNGNTIRGFDPVAYGKALSIAGYPLKADPAKINYPRMVALLILMTLMVSMVYGPVAGYIVALFPANIRYTSMSFAYHIGSGVIGGSLPFVATYLTMSGGNVLAGLWYPIVITALVGVIGSFLLPNIRNKKI
jgi:MFS family permease